MRPLLLLVTCTCLPVSAAFAAPDLALVTAGHSDYVVVTPADALPAETYAASELVVYLQQLTGAELAVVQDDAPLAPHEIILGSTNRRLAALALTLPADRWGRDGFSLRTAGERLILAGDRPRGTLYAVYDFLERQGVRFFAPDVTLVPRRPSLTCPPLNEVQRPAFEGRGFMSWAVQQSDNDWAVRLRYNSPWFGQWQEERGGHLRYGFGPHSFFTIIPPERYFQDHPEWFSEIDGQRTPGGQLCLTNPDLRDEVVRLLRERMAQLPDVWLWDISQVDNLSYCRCPRCSALADAEGSQSGPIIHFLNAIAERLEGEFPEAMFTTFAYAYGVEPPKQVQARRNVGVRICTYDKDCLRPLAADSPVEASRKMAAEFEGWAEHAQNLLVWDYGTNFADYLDIFPDYYTWGPNFRYYRDHHVRIVDMQGSYSVPWGELGYLRAYVMGKLLWDPEQDDRALIREYCDGVYGPAGKLVAQFLDFCVTAARAAHENKAMVASGWEFNKGGYRYEDLQVWRDRLEAALAAEQDPVRVKHLKLLLLPIYKDMVYVRQPQMVTTATGLKPAGEISEDYRKTVDRLFALGRDLEVVRYREGAGDFDTLEQEVRASLRDHPFVFLRSPTMSVRTLPGSGGLLSLVQTPPDTGPTRMSAYETYVGSRWHDPGWCEPYRLEESTPARLRMTALLSGGMELERTYELTAATTLQITEKLTNRSPGQLVKPFLSNHIFPLESREAEALYLRQPDGTWQEDRYPEGRYEQMGWLGYARGGGWALINRKTGRGVVVRFQPEDVAIMGFWVDNNFSFQLTTPPYRLDKDESATRVETIQFLSPEESTLLRTPPLP